MLPLAKAITMSIPVALLVVLTPVVPVQLTAQEPAGVSDSMRARVLAQLPAGAWVRLGAGNAIFPGTIVDQDRGTIRIRTAEGGEHVLESRAVHTVWIQQGRATRAGAHNGALVGSGVGVIVGLLAGGFMCETGCGGARMQAGVAGLATGAGVGALVGAAVGSVIPHWERLLP